MGFDKHLMLKLRHWFWSDDIFDVRERTHAAQRHWIQVRCLSIEGIQMEGVAPGTTRHSDDNKGYCKYLLVKSVSSPDSRGLGASAARIYVD